MKTVAYHLQSFVLVFVGLLAVHTTSAESYLWNVATPSTTSSWNNNGNWTPSTGTPGAADTAIFGDVGTVADALTLAPFMTNNVVSVDTRVDSLKYTNHSATASHVTQIPDGVTLSVGSLLVGGAIETTTPTLVAMNGGGTLYVDGSITNGNIGVASPSTINKGTILDLSTLSNFVFSATNGVIQVGSGNRSAAIFHFAAASNHVTAAAMNLNTLSTSATGNGQNVYLGTGSNIFNLGVLNVGAGRNGTTLKWTSSTKGSLRLRGVGGTDADVCNVTIGNKNNSGGSGSAQINAVTLAGRPVDMKIGTLTLGMDSNATGTQLTLNNNSQTVEFSFGAGTVSATNIVMAYTTTPNSNSVVISTLIVSNTGTLYVGSGGLQLVAQNALPDPQALIQPSKGFLNIINGGTVICSNSISKLNSNGVGTITMTSGTLNLVNGKIGSATAPIALTIGDSVLTLPFSKTVPYVFVSDLNNNSSTNNTINLTGDMPIIFGYPTQIPIISYSYQYNFDFQLGSLPSPLKGYLVDNTINHTIDLVITNGPTPLQLLTWKGNVNSNWDTTTKNWVNPGLASTNFYQSDYVTFDDSGTLTTVNLTTSLTPGSVTNSGTKSYTFSGPGALVGDLALTKSGAGTLTLANSGINTLSGGVRILGGTLKISGSADRLPTNAAVTLANASGVYLNLNSQNQTLGSLSGGGVNGSGNILLGSGNLTIIGDGGSLQGVITGTGSLIKSGDTNTTQTISGANLYSGGTRVLVGTLIVTNTTGSGTGTGYVSVENTNAVLRIGAGGANGSVGVSVITNSGTVVLNRSDDLTYATLITGTGSFAKEGTNTVTISTVNTYTNNCMIRDGVLRISNAGAVGGLGGQIQVGGNTTKSRLELTNGVTLTKYLRLSAKTGTTGNNLPVLVNVGGSNTVAGPIELYPGGSQWPIQVLDGYLKISGPMTYTNLVTNLRVVWLGGSNASAVGEWSGSIVNNSNPDSPTNTNVRKDDVCTWILSGANTYTGSTVVSNGTLLVNGSIAAGGSVTSDGGILGGNGVISAPVIVNALGTLAPGNSTNSIGTLTINNSLTLGGTTLMEVSHTAWDQVAGVTSLTLGGTLQVVVNGTLAGNEVFQLFSASGIGGGFSTTTLPPLTPPLAWNTSRLTTEGILQVTGGVTPPAPTITNQPQSLSVSVGDTAQFSVTAGPALLSYQWRFNTTNLSNGGRISGATGSVLTITNAQAADAGQYTVVVSNSGGAVTSAPPAVLTVASTTPPTLGFSQSGNGLTFSWTGAGYRLQSQTNTINVGISTNWTDYPGGGSSPVGVPISPANPTVFFRLIK